MIDKPILPIKWSEMAARTQDNVSVSDIVVLFQCYMDEAEQQIESDGFLPSLDVTNHAARDLMNDMILYWVESNMIKADTDARVTCTEVNYV